MLKIKFKLNLKYNLNHNLYWDKMTIYKNKKTHMKVNKIKLTYNIYERWEGELNSFQVLLSKYNEKQQMVGLLKMKFPEIIPGNPTIKTGWTWKQVDFKNIKWFLIKIKTN